MKIKVPWRLTNFYEQIINTLCWYRSFLFCIFKDKKKQKIYFNCGFHGKTGGAIAITTIANLLSDHFEVFFLSTPTSPLNRYLNPRIKLTNKVSFSMDLYICDASCRTEFLSKVKALGKPLVVSCHGLPTASQQLHLKKLYRSLDTADIVHFVSEVQQAEFKLPAEKYTIISNTCSKVNKRIHTNSVGVVGNLDIPQKGANISVSIALASNADNIHLWGVEKSIWPQKNVITHSWEHSKFKIYNSFDVLVFMSETETFGLVVIEALSAGIPCLLSPIPAFQQFKGIPGVIIVDDPNDLLTNVQQLNYLLANKAAFSSKLMKFFDDNYSHQAAKSKWKKFAKEQISKKNI